MGNKEAEANTFFLGGGKTTNILLKTILFRIIVMLFIVITKANLIQIIVFVNALIVTYGIYADYKRRKVIATDTLIKSMLKTNAYIIVLYHMYYISFYYMGSIGVLLVTILIGLYYVYRSREQFKQAIKLIALIMLQNKRK